MATDDLTDADVLALLRDGERACWLDPYRVSGLDVLLILRRLALARREARELRDALSGRTMYDAAEVEREEIAKMVEDEAYLYSDDSRRIALCDVAAQVRARGQS